jgi:RNA polymerase sigma factor (sigma-70 family)
MLLYDRILTRQAARALAPHMDPENAVAETWHQAYRGAGRYDPQWLPYPWLAAICARVCLKQRRALARLLPTFRLRGRTDPEAGVGTDRADEETHVRAALVRLPWRQRQVVALRFLFDVSVREIAALLDRTPGNVERLLLRGLERLRRGRSAPRLHVLFSASEEGL